MKRILCILLSLAMIFSLLPVSAFAEEETAAMEECLESPDETVPAALEEGGESEEADRDAAPEIIEDLSVLQEDVEPEEAAAEETLLLGSDEVATIGGTDGLIEWELIERQLIIRGSGAMNDYSKEGTAPWAEWIRSGAVQAVRIESGVTHVGSYAFYTSPSDTNEIRSVTFPSTLTSIGEGAFTRCKLTAVNFPENLAELGRAAFSYNNLGSVTMPQSLRTIGSSCFGGNTALYQVVLNEGLLEIGSNAFQGGTAKKIDIPASVDSVGDNIAPQDCALIFRGNMPEKMSLQVYSMVYYSAEASGWDAYTGNKEIYVGDGHSSQGTIGTVVYEISVRGDVTISGTGVIPDYPNVGQAPWYAALSSSAEATVTIGAGISSLGSRAFSGCTGIQTVVFHGAPTLIADDAFEGVTAEVTYNCCAKGTGNSWNAVVGSSLGGSLTWTATHVPETLPAVEAACTENGMTEGSRCSRCEQILEEQQPIEAKGHTEETIPGYAQTCECTGMSDGLRCTECGSVMKEQVVIPAHFPAADERIEPNCTTIGWTAGSHCEICGTVLEPQQEITPLGHDLQLVSAATGVKEHWTCTVCMTRFLDAEGEVEVSEDDLRCGVWIEYHLYGGSNAPQNPDYVDTEGGEAKITLAHPTRSGYLFDGWYLDENYETFAPAPELILTEKGTVELYAKWNPITYDIVYHANGGSGKMNGVAALPFDEEYYLSPASFTRKGYCFRGWNTEKDGSGTHFLNEQTVQQLTDINRKVITLYAQWELGKYNITYVLPEEAENVPENPGMYSYNTKSSVPLQPPTGPETLGSFLGWYTDAAYKTKVTSIKAGSTGDRVLYSRWGNTEYSITYVLDDGCTNDASNPAGYTSASANITLKAPTGPEAYGKFAGWYLDAGLKTRISTIRKGSAGNLVLYPKWTPAKYTIKYVLNGGVNSKANPTSFTILSVPVSLEAPSRKGYDFAGWYLDAELTQPVTAICEVLGNMVVYAGWCLSDYSIHFHSRGGSAVEPISYQLISPSFRLPVPVRRGYTFAGWYKEPSLKSKLTTVNKGSAADYDLYAKWTPNSYTIRFHANGGKGTTKTISTQVNSYVLLSVNRFTRNGYRFTGWNTSPDGSGAAYSAEASVVNLSRSQKGVVTLYAQWETVTYSITYELNGGVNDPANPCTYTITQTPVQIAAPSREGYAFAGWYKDAKFRTAANLKAGSFGDVILYAKWKPVI